MTVRTFTTGGRLQGRHVFLSASVPNDASADEALLIEEAVMACVRAVLSERGTIVFGGHPAISPFVATVAAEYAGREHGQPLVIIHQAEPFRPYAPEATLRMSRLGYARIEWTPPENKETFVPGQPRPYCPDTLEAMRHALMQKNEPVAMVVIGGMSGIADEYRIFRAHQQTAPIYVLPTTGGETRALAEKRDVIAIDRQVLTELGQALRPSTYALVMQRMIEDLVGRFDVRR